jgi:hypothetical protein
MPNRLIDLTNKRFTRLVVIRRVKNRGKHPYWLAKCDCGNSTTARGNHLRAGDVQSCGCIAVERGKTLSIRYPRDSHKGTGTPEYTAWNGMKNRCYRRKTWNYPRYGGRGIRVCKRWLGANGFVNFLADMGYRPSPAHSLDRVNNDGNYEPSNCRWATPKEQANNRRKRGSKR